MRKIHRVLRLFFEAGLSIRAIARSIQASPSTVGDYIRRARTAGLSWPLPEGLDERTLEARLFPCAEVSARVERAIPDWTRVHTERRRPGVTLALLWEEYKAEHPQGLQYSQFCERYRVWRGRLDVVMRQTHRAGEKLFVDYAGQCVPVVDRITGELRNAQMFVAVLGASNYTFAEATWTQTLPDWCASHVRALSFFNGVPEIVVPDNLKSAITRPHRYEPDAHPTYTDLAEHYGFAILPARVRRPRDKAKVEVGVQVVERWILAALRHRTFFSLGELNRAIAERLEWLNARAFRKLPGSRRSAFESIDRAALRALPAEPYVFAQWKKVRVHVDYHVELERHYYSVPHTLVGRQLHARYTERTVELFHRGQRVASHLRAHLPGRHTTVSEHMPEKHRRFAKQWSPERFSRWAETIGPATAALITESSTPGATPSRATAPASASCAWPRPTPMTGSKPPHNAPSGVAPVQWTPSDCAEEVFAMAKTHPPYAPEFRRQMVELVRSGRSAGELAREFGCCAQTIRNWVRQSDRDEGRRDDGLTSSELEELRRLRRENCRLREEREILKKAAVWFARETGSVPGRSSGS